MSETTTESVLRESWASQYPVPFLNAVAETLEREGGFVNDKHDPGGATNWGISLRFLRQTYPGLDWDLDGDGDVDADDMKLLTGQQAVSLYYKHFWQPMPMHSVLPSFINQKRFDTSVNLGIKGATKVFQRALTSITGSMVEDDGIFGEQTQNVAASISVQSRGIYALLFAMKSEQAGYYRSLIAVRNIFEKYRKGWIRRAYDL